MQIVCATPQAVAEVLTILYAAQLQPDGDFTIQAVRSPKPPLIIRMIVALTAMQVAKIRAIPDTTIIE
jgi:hypothetical protein